jgi:hypothetical protein
MKNNSDHTASNLVQAKQKQLVQRIGQRILSEANDLKRTFKSICDELKLDIQMFEKIISGDSSYDDAVELAKILASNYPVKLNDLLLDIPDHDQGIKIMRYEESVASKRVFNRSDKVGNKTPYYEYRDTATAKLSPFKPEWIEELRIVENADPNNDDVAYNNGHFLHQMTAFIGPVNFYWEVDGTKYCKEMDSGSSNYITPFIKHSFTSRDSSQPAIIIAVTFSSDAGRARDEFYSLGSERIQSYVLDNRNVNKGVSQLIKQVLDDKCLTQENLSSLASRNKIDLDCGNLLDIDASKDEADLKKLATLLNVKPEIFDLPHHIPGNEVEVKDHAASESYIFNSNAERPDYIINALAGNNRMPLMNGFNFQIVSGNQADSSTLKTSLHSYIFNHSDTPITLEWIYEGMDYSDQINPNDSVYLEPQLEHKFWKESEEDAFLYIFRVGGEINLSVQKEISSFANSDRIIETISWFN